MLRTLLIFATFFVLTSSIVIAQDDSQKLPGTASGSFIAELKAGDVCGIPTVDYTIDGKNDQVFELLLVGQYIATNKAAGEPFPYKETGCILKPIYTFQVMEVRGYGFFYAYTLYYELDVVNDVKAQSWDSSTLTTFKSPLHRIDIWSKGGNGLVPSLPQLKAAALDNIPDLYNIWLEVWQTTHPR